MLILVAIASVAIAYWSHQIRREAKIAASLPVVSAVDSSNNANPVAIVTVLNELRQLGAADVLDTLHRFDNEYTSKSENVEILVQLLFERKNTNEHYPSIARGDLTGYELDRDAWHSDFTIVDDIPFATNVLPVSYSGFVFSRSYAIKWAEQRGRLIETALHPTDDPFKACDKLIPKLIIAKNNELKDQAPEVLNEIPGRVTNRLQEQVYQMVQHLVPEFQSPELGEWAKYPNLWKNLKAECIQNGLRWSPNENGYVFTK